MSKKYDLDYLIEYYKFIERTRQLDSEEPLDITERYISLATEAGEVLQLYKKFIRDGTSINQTKQLDELGDVFYSLCAILNLTNYTLQDVVRHNMKKLKRRYHII